MKVYVSAFLNDYPTDMALIMQWYDETSMTFVYQSIFRLPKDNSITNTNVAIAAVKAEIYSVASGQGYSITDADIIANWAINGLPLSFSFNNAASRSFTTGTGATGFQVSASRNVMVNYSVTIVSTATIAGSASGTVVLEVAPTNSATPGDWVEIARFTNGQAITLALTLQSVQTLAHVLMAVIPAGYYAKLRTINNAGTPTFSFNSGQEVLL